MRKVNQTFVMAQRMGKNRMAAARIRARYLLSQLDKCLQSSSDVAIYDGFKIADELSELFHQAYKTSTVSKKYVTYTPEQIEQAKQYPVNELITFIRGRATAWCHDDRKPSLYYGKRKNLAICPVCNKTFDPIKILMQRDNYTFQEAIRYLLGL